jgi:hypothetical protein
LQLSNLKRLPLIIAISPLLFYSIAVAQTQNSAAKLFDEFGDIEASDLIARLDNFAVHIQQEPNAKGFLVVYRTRRDLPGLSNRYAHRMKSYLVDLRGMPAERLVTVDGGEASCLTQELWIVSPGSAPKPRADAYQNTYTPSVEKFDEHYLGADEVSYWKNSREDLLEAFGLELQKHPKSIAYLVAYQGIKGTGRRNALNAVGRERNFLAKEFRIKSSRIRMINGGFREWPTMELWIAYEPGTVPLISSYRYVRRGR